MNMRSLIRILPLLLIVFIASCTGKSTDNTKIKLIPQEELVSVMTDLYIGDGLLGFPPVRNLFTAKDSIANYIDILKQARLYQRADGYDP